LDGPLKSWHCVAGWLTAGGSFIILDHLLKGPAPGDDYDSALGTWAIAHGHLACAYPPASSVTSTPLRAPLYPLVSGLAAAVGRIGHTVVFPSNVQLGPHCSRAAAELILWARHAKALPATLNLGYLGWFVFLGGLVLFLRSVGLGRTGWEPATLLIALFVPPILMCMQQYFHPEDLLSMGLALAALAFARQDRWAWAGLMLGLAFTAQQFALLVAAPLFFMAPPARRTRLLVAAVGIALVIVAPLDVVTSGREWHVLTSGQTGTNGTVLANIGLQGAPLYVVCRVLPVALAAALGFWAARRFGSSVLQPVVLTCVMSLAVLARIAFETSLYGYYLMAVAVMVLLCDVVRRRLTLVTIGFYVVALAFFDPIPWGGDPVSDSMPMWSRQLILVAYATGLALVPLVRAWRSTETIDGQLVPVAHPG
jgi:hypothetical protein